MVETVAKSVLKTGLIGQNISRTRLPAALHKMCDEAGMTVQFRLIDTDGEPGFDLSGCLSQIQQDGWAGVSVTHPFKPFAATLVDGPARRLGAANLIVLGDPRRALNTDYAGFVSSWRDVFSVQKPGTVVMAGAGGVARAIAFALVNLGADEVMIMDLDAEKATCLAREIGAVGRAVALADLSARVARADGLVNATYMGMAGYGGSAFALPVPRSVKWAFDAVYTPIDTAFLRAARNSEARVMTGFDLFRHMAVQQFTTLTGIIPEPGILDRLAALKPMDQPA